MGSSPTLATFFLPISDLYFYKESVIAALSFWFGYLMRPIDWSPLVVLLSALAAAAISSALPETFFLKKETAAVIIWVPMVLVVLKAIRMIRHKRMMADRLHNHGEDEDKEKSEDGE